MQIIFSNQFGCHSKSEVILNFPELINVAVDERNQALEQGWLLTIKNNKEYWHQSRSTRTKLSDTNYSKLDNSISLNKPYPMAEIDEIYNSYCSHKNFKKYLEVGEFLDIDTVVGYYQGSKLIAWTKLRHYSKENIESVQFAWNYDNPERHLGLSSLRHEIAWAKDSGYEYFYMGSSYEKTNIYKSNIDGFQWWTGREWSVDKDEYIYLCKRDSKISSYHQIHTALANLQHDRNIL
jgi:arginyl-tRNA--protein-N-Asp/Glu arginylyltransferase